MQKSTKIVLVAVAGLAVIGGAAFAQKGWRHGFGGHGGMGFEQMSERYDTNKDGKISQEEIDANRTSWLGEFDGDKSGSLALDRISEPLAEGPQPANGSGIPAI